MTDKIIENNQVEIMGKIASRFTFSHQVFGEGFYMVDVLVKRLSDSEDRIPVMISERLVDVNEDYEGEYIHVMGQFRSYNRHEEKKNRLVLSVFAAKPGGLAAPTWPCVAGCSMSTLARGKSESVFPRFRLYSVGQPTDFLN